MRKGRRWAAAFAVAIGLASIGLPSASADDPAPTRISVSCIDWFLSGGHQDHIHVELYVEDSIGQPVVGATVVFETSYDMHDGGGPVVYATNTGETRDRPGKNRGRGCAVDPRPTSGSTGWYCCSGAAKWSGEEPPGKRACPSGFFTVKVLRVNGPAGTNLVWDGITPPNGREFSATHD